MTKMSMLCSRICVPGAIADDLFGKAAESQAKKILDVQLESRIPADLIPQNLKPRPSSSISTEHRRSRRNRTGRGKPDNEWLFSMSVPGTPTRIII